MNIIEKDGKYYPLVEENEDGYTRCPFCLRFHMHGRGEANIEHRLPHCYTGEGNVECLCSWGLETTALSK